MLADVFGYIREYIIKREKSNYAEVKNVKYDLIMNVLSKDDNKEQSNVRDFIEKLGFNADDVVYFYSCNNSRNKSTHFIDRRKHEDVILMKRKIDKFENEVNKLNEENDLFDYKKNLLVLIENVRRYIK